MTLTPVRASALHTSKQISCASSVAAAEVNPGVWFAPFISVGMAAKQDKYVGKKAPSARKNDIQNPGWIEGSATGD
jgi:hypothetical protein